MSAGFQCKKFFVGHDQCAMKVGTDGLLLGAFAPLPLAGSPILDIGAGSGLISLMLAQRTAGANPIDAIELDHAAAEQARRNTANSPWSSAIQLIKGDILTYQPAKRYRLIVSNPPFFQQALPAQDPRRHQARHTDSLPFAALLQKAADLLAEGGTFCLILPLQSAESFSKLATHAGWYLAAGCQVKTTPDKPASRVMQSWQREVCATQHSQLVIHHGNGYSADYRNLLKDFYLKF